MRLPTRLKTRLDTRIPARMRSNQPAPTLLLDYISQNYVVNELPKTFEEAHTFSRGTPGTLFNSSKIMTTAGVDEPRLTHDPATGEVLGLLLEEQRTNLAIQSESFTSPWGGGTVAQSSVISPSGSNFKLVTSENGVMYCQQVAAGLDTSAVYSVSCYIKKASSSIVYVGVGTACELMLDLDSGLVLDAGLSIASKMENVGGGVYRWWAMFTPVNTTHGLRPVFSKSTLSVDAYSWGYQFEKGSTPVSYIPTESSTVTRQADIATRTLGSEYNASEGTLKIVAKAHVGDVIARLGALEIIADSEDEKQYVLSYNTDPLATELEIMPSANGTVKSIKYYPVKL